MEAEDKKRIWFCSNYGLEFQTILKKLNKSGEEYYIVSNDKKMHWRNVSIASQNRAREVGKEGYKIYGIGLEGNIPGINSINLQTFENEYGEEVSLLEQVNDIVGDKLTLDEQFISANAIGGADKMRQLAGRLKMNPKDTNAVIENILFRNRRAKGIPLEKEAEALEQVQSTGKTDYELLAKLDDILQPNENDFVRI